MATGGSDVLSDEIVNIKCCICTDKGRTREAERYCVQCQDYFCSSCVDIHNVNPAARRHKLLDKNDFRSKGTDGSLPSLPTERCTLHPTKIVDMFCKEHDEVACASCIAVSHRTCTQIHSITDELGSLFSEKDLTHAKQKINQTKAIIAEIKKSKEEKAKKLTEAFDKAVDSVKAFRRELELLLDDLEQVTITELKKEYDKINASLTKDIEEMESFINSLDDAISQLKKAKGNKAQEYVCMKTSQKVMAKGEEIGNVQQGKTDVTFCFKANQSVMDVMQECQILGSVTQHQTSLYKVQNKKEIDVQLSDDKMPCFIYGSCIIDYRYLLLADHNNKKLKRLDLSTDSLKDYINLQAWSYAICEVSKTEAVVALYTKSVQFVSIGDKMTVTRTLTLNHDCFGLAYKDGKLFVSDQSKTFYVHDINGNELGKIAKNGSGNGIFQNSMHILAHANENKVYIADKGNGVVVVDIQGNHLFTLTDPTLKDTIGICTDGRNVFVCGRKSRNIVQFRDDLKVKGEIVKGFTNAPVSLCLDTKKSRLLVTLGNYNKLTVLELE